MTEEGSAPLILWPYMLTDEQTMAVAVRIADAVEGKTPTSKLNRFEKIIWMEMFSRQMSQPGPDEIAHHAARMARQEGIDFEVAFKRVRLASEDLGEVRASFERRRAARQRTARQRGQPLSR